MNWLLGGEGSSGRRRNNLVRTRAGELVVGVEPRLLALSQANCM